MRYFGKSDGDSKIIRMSTDITDFTTPIYVYDAGESKYISNSVSDWTPYLGRFEGPVGTVIDNSFIAEEAYENHYITGDEGVPAVLVYHYKEGVNTMIEVVKENHFDSKLLVDNLVFV